MEKQLKALKKKASIIKSVLYLVKENENEENNVGL